MMDSPGYQFTPDLQQRLRQSVNGGLLPTNASQALQVLSLRLPDFLGGAPIAPDALLRPGMTRGASLFNGTAQGQAPSTSLGGAPSAPAAATAAPSAMPSPAAQTLNFNPSSAAPPSVANPVAQAPQQVSPFAIQSAPELASLQQLMNSSLNPGLPSITAGLPGAGGQQPLPPIGAQPASNGAVATPQGDQLTGLGALLSGFGSRQY